MDKIISFPLVGNTTTLFLITKVIDRCQSTDSPTHHKKKH